MERIEVTQEERESVEEARDSMHRAVLAILRNHGQDPYNGDLSEIGEAIALEGYFEK